VLVLLASIALAVVASWPLARDAWQVFPSEPTWPDIGIGVWFAAHMAEVASGGGALWAGEQLHWPIGQDCRLLLWNLGIQVITLPLFLVFEAIPAWNLSMIWLGGLNGLGGWVLGRIAGGDRASGVVGAALLVCSPFVWAELAQGRGEQALFLFLALTVAGLLALWREPDRRVAVLTGLAWGLAGICYWFYGYFLLLIVAALALAALARRRWRRLASLAVSGGVAAAVAAPLAIGVLIATQQAGSPFQQAAEDIHLVSLAQSSWTGIELGSLLWPLWMPVQLRDCVPMVLSLCLLAAVPLWRRSSWLPVLGLVSLVLAMGRLLYWTEGDLVLFAGLRPLMPFIAVQDWLPGFWRFLWPYRYVALASVAAAGCAGVLVARLGRWRWAGAALLVLALTGEHRAALRSCPEASIWTAPVSFEVPTLFREIAQEPGTQPVLMLPFRGEGGSLLWNPYHRQPSSEGLGDGEEFLQDAEWAAWIGASPVMMELQAMGDALHPELVADPSLSPDLARLGFRWAVLDLRRRHGGVQRYEEFFRRSPDFQDAHIVAWRL